MDRQPPALSGEPLRSLHKLLEERGRVIAGDRRLCAALLRDICGTHKLEINLLLAAIDEHIPEELMEPRAAVPEILLLGRLTTRLVGNQGLDPDNARWAVETWQHALQDGMRFVVRLTGEPDGASNLGEVLEQAPDGAVVDLGVGEYVLSRPLTVTRSVTLVGVERSTAIVCTAEEHVLRLTGPGPFTLRDIAFHHTGTLGADVVIVDGGEVTVTRCAFSGAARVGGGGRRWAAAARSGARRDLEVHLQRERGQRDRGRRPGKHGAGRK